MKSTQDTNSFYKPSIFVFLVTFLLGFTPLIAQYQYWQTPFEGGMIVHPDASGSIDISYDKIAVYDGKATYRFSAFGNLLQSEIGNGAFNYAFFVDDDRDDIIVKANRHAVYNDLNLIVSTKGNSIPQSTEILSSDYGNQVPSHFKPICLKIDDNDYFLVSREKVFHVKIIDIDNHQINYSVAHNSERITGGVVKDGLIYLVDVDGNILRYDDQGFVDQLLIADISPLEIVDIGDGFALTGEDNGETFLAKISTGGVLEWKKTFPQKRGISLMQTATKDFVVVGTTNSDEGFVLKTDADGNVKWLIDDLVNSGVAVNENQFGAIYILCRLFDTPVSSTLIKVGPDGETGPQVQNNRSFPLAVNNINANVSPMGQLFFDGNNSQYFFPNGSSTATIFAADLWLGGLDDAGDIHLAVKQYVSVEDFQMGPYDANPSFFERIWSVSKTDIAVVINDLADGEQNFDWPRDIIHWPAKGNTIENQDGQTYLIEEDLAPFVDSNNDGVYNVNDGDYPLIKGEQMLWWVYNDNSLNQMTAAEKVGVEIKASLYATSCNVEHISNNTTFLDYEITNKSTFSYPDFSLGFWSDPDLGCFTDDFIGSLPEYNAAYVYNEDALDGDNDINCPAGVSSFGEEVPIQSMVFLNQTLNSYTYFLNPGIGIPTPGTADPSIAVEYLNYMNGKWRDGSPMTSGGTGYNPLSTDYVTHAFPGEPSNPNEWSLCSIDDASFADRRMVMGTNFPDFNPGDVIELNMAFITSEGASLPCPDIDIVTGDIATIQEVFDQGGSAYQLDLYAGLEIDYNANTAVIDAGAGAASYEWSTGSMEQSIEVTTAQEYSVTVTDYYGCEHVGSIEVDFINAVGEISKSPDHIVLHPNPTRDEIFINTTDGSAIESMGVFSLAGKMIKQINTVGNNNPISIGELPPGMYLLIIESGDKSYVKKVVLSK